MLMIENARTAWSRLLAAFCVLQHLQFDAPWRGERCGC